MAKNFSQFTNKDTFETDDYLVGYRGTTEYRWKLEVSALPSAIVDLQEQGANTGGNAMNWFIMGDGAVRCCGSNSTTGEGGTGLNDVISQPRLAAFNPPLSPGEKVIKLYTQEKCTYAVTSLGSVYGTGQNNNYQLGLGDQVNRNVFSRIIRPNPSTAFDGDDKSTQIGNPGEKVVQMAMGCGIGGTNLTVFARTDQGRIYGWGFNGSTSATSGRLGTGSTVAYVETPTLIPSSYFGNQAVSKIISAGNDGYQASYALTATGKIYATGHNSVGQLGQGNTLKLSTWTLMSQGLPSNYVAVDIETGGEVSSATLRSTVWAILNNGTLFGCGYNGNSQASGNGSTSNQTTFIQIGGPLSSETVRKISVHADYSFTTIFALCGTNANGPYKLFGWGENARGQLGTGDTTDRGTPTIGTWPFGTGQTVKQVAIGGNDSRKNTIVLDSNNYLWSTGYGNNGILGNGTRSDRSVFRRIPLNPALGTPIKVITTNNGTWDANSIPHTTALALLTTGKAMAWGYDTSTRGQLGVDSSPRLTTIPAYVQMIV